MFYCFLDGLLEYFQISIALEHHEKMTFTCFFGAIAYQQMLFGLCNDQATFQSCMITIFNDLLEDIIEVFMDDSFVFRDSFDHYLRNMMKVLKRCEETNLVLNSGKCHFMVHEGIVLGHKISQHMIEVKERK